MARVRYLYTYDTWDERTTADSTAIVSQPADPEDTWFFRRKHPGYTPWVYCGRLAEPLRLQGNYMTNAVYIDPASDKANRGIVEGTDADLCHWLYVQEGSGAPVGGPDKWQQLRARNQVIDESVVPTELRRYRLFDLSTIKGTNPQRHT